MTTPSKRRANALWLLLAAAITFFILSLFPIGRWLLWPFTLLTTFIHELGHGLTAILLGGQFLKMEVYANGSGVAYTTTDGSSWRLALVAAGGLLAPSILGGLLIMAGTKARWSSRALMVLGLVMLISCVIWIRSVTGLVSLILIGAFFFWLSRHAELALQHFLIQFVGVHMLVDTCTRTMRYLFTPSTNIDGVVRHSDTGAIAANVGGPYWFWGGAIGVLSLAIVFLSIRRAYLTKL